MKEKEVAGMEGEEVVEGKEAAGEEEVCRSLQSL